ncbi:hypothetical protein KRX19_02310 [Cardiobacteriaceae bacterium TAE3-ERU3]|nr:hypothetical protein [Cardiobacteriaceae bacterium TAE3-ERU3]
MRLNDPAFNKECLKENPVQPMSRTEKILLNISGYVLLTWFVVILLLPTVIEYFVNVDEYIAQSDDVTISPYQLVSTEHFVETGYGKKSVYLIKAGNTFYALSYYQKSKKDVGIWWRSDLQKHHRVIIKLNPVALNKHRGTQQDPIPVLNFAFAPNEDIWDEESYRYNVLAYRVREDMLHIKSYYWILNGLAVISMLIFFVLILKERHREHKALKGK